MALFTRTGLDRFNILIRFYDLNIGSRRTLYEPPTLMDKAAETTGWRQEGRKWQTQPFLMYLCLNVMHISSCSAHTGTPLRFSIIRPRHPKPSPNCNKKTWPWSRYCKSNKEEIDGWNDSGLILRGGDSCSKQLIAIGLETDESRDTAQNFSGFSWLQQYPANTLKVQGSDFNSWY